MLRARKIETVKGLLQAVIESKGNDTSYAQLSNITGRSKSSLLNNLNMMEEKGLIFKERHDAGSNRYYITEDGLDYLKRAF